MATVHIPPLLRDLTGGRAELTAAGHTLRHVLEALEEACPGTRARLCVAGRLRADVMATVDGRVARLGLAQPVREESEIRFLPVMSGG
jgi:sulfur-carrier protein